MRGIEKEQLESRDEKRKSRLEKERNRPNVGLENGESCAGEMRERERV